MYLACLRLGESLISDIAGQAKIKRPTAYNVIEGLLDKKAIKKKEVGSRIYYLATPPNELFRIIEQKKNQFKRSLPELNAIFQNRKGAPEIRYFEGRDAVSKLLKDVLNKNYRDLIFIMGNNDFMKKYPELFKLLDGLINKSTGKIMSASGQQPCLEIISKENKIIISWKNFITAIDIQSVTVASWEHDLFHVEQIKQ